MDMADNIQNKSLEQLISAFTNATNQTKELDTAISTFSDVINSFNETLSKMDVKFQLKELADLSDDALNKLKEVKAYNEHQIFEKLESIINKSVSEQFRSIEYNLSEINRGYFAEIKNALEVTGAGKGIQGGTSIQNDDIQRLERRIEKLTQDFKNKEIEYNNRIMMLEVEVNELRMQGNNLLIDEEDLPF